MDINVVCSTYQKSYYDWIVVIAPVLISAAVAVVGVFQYKVNKNKLRLDLYNRRFIVYEQSLAYFQSYYSQVSTSEYIDECANNFSRVFRESLFLFGEDSEAYKLLIELNDTLSFLIQFNKKFKSEPYDQETLKAWVSIKESKQEPLIIMKALEKALMPWLDFKRVER